VPHDSIPHFVATNVWTFAMSMVGRASVEWRLVITKHGCISGGELEAWTSHLAVAAMNEDLQPLRIFIVSTDTDSHFAFVNHADVQKVTSPHRPWKHLHGSIFADVLSPTYALFWRSRFSHGSREALVDPPFVAEMEEEPREEDQSVLPLATSTLLRVGNESDCWPTAMVHIHLMHSVRNGKSTDSSSDEDVLQDITRNFYELSVLGRERWTIGGNGTLPFHLAALDVMHLALDRGDVGQEQ